MKTMAELKRVLKVSLFGRFGSGDIQKNIREIILFLYVSMVVKYGHQMKGFVEDQGSSYVLPYNCSRSEKKNKSQ